MKIETIMSLSEDSILEQIKKLEERGFYLHVIGHSSKAPRVHHKTRAAAKRRLRSSPEWIAHNRDTERRRQGTLRGKWRHLRRTLNNRAKTRPTYAFLISFEEWRMLWRKAGSITMGDGSLRVAWKARGRDTEGGWGTEPQRPQLRRWDTSKPYTLDNVYVQYKRQVLADGQELYEQNINDEKEIENKA